MTAYEFGAELWRYPGGAAWYFVTLPTDVADDIAEAVPHRRGFGSVPVAVTVGATTWQTSLFPDTKAASYVLPIKRGVRTAESLADGDDVAVRMVIDTARL